LIKYENSDGEIMIITIKDEVSRFGVRVAAIIYNKDMTKVFLQRQKDHDFYMFPGGRLEINEDSETAIKRELMEELGIKEEVYLKYIAESFIKFPSKKYHEIGFYFIVKIDEDKYQYHMDNEYFSKDSENDGESYFRWFDIDKINDVKIMPEFLKSKLGDQSNILEHIVYDEY